jgi:hypothetical protein
MVYQDLPFDGVEFKICLPSCFSISKNLRFPGEASLEIIGI